MNWKALITEIRGYGLSQAQIGQRIGRSQAWVASVLAEKYTDLRWSDGQALLSLRDALRGTEKKVV